MEFTDPYFENICDIGDLFLDEIFFEFETEPILFLCRDKSNNMYFCLCSEIRKVQGWTICKISSNILTDVVDGNITIREAFKLSGEDLYIVHYTKADGLSSKQASFDEINEDDLPEEGV